MHNSKFFETEIEIDGITQIANIQYEGTVLDPTDIYLELVEINGKNILPQMEQEERKGSLALRYVLDACYQNLMERRYEFLTA